MNAPYAREQLTSYMNRDTRKAFDAGQVEYSYPRGRVLLGKGELSDGIYLIRSGKVRVSRESNGAAGGSRIARPGEILGLSTAVSGRPSESTAETLGPSRVSFMSKEALMKLMHRDAEFAYRVVRILCESLADPFDRFRSPRRRKRRLTSKH
jgi:CRP-like cAMP-binding protein